MKYILFYGIQAGKLLTIRDTILSMQGEWHALLPSTYAEAVEWVRRGQVNVAVVEIQLSEQSTIDLLSQIQKTHPQIVRIAISDQRAIVDHLRAASLAQQVISRNFSQEDLKTTIERALTLGELLRNNLLQKLVSQVQYLPSLPNLYLQIAEELNSANPSADRVGQIITQDLSMSAKVLQIVNSAHFGLPYPVANPAQATTLLGLETIRDIVLSIKVFSSFDQLKIRQLGLTGLWNHSVLAGAYAKQIAHTISGDKKKVNFAFTAGLLHDIGKLVLAENLPMKYQSAMGLASQKRIQLSEAEQSVFGANHAQVGAYLLWLWDLPEAVVTAVAYHHVPEEEPGDLVSPLTSVHLANVYAHELSSNSLKWPCATISEGYLTKIRLSTPLEQLRQICQDIAQDQ